MDFDLTRLAVESAPPTGVGFKDRELQFLIAAYDWAIQYFMTHEASLSSWPAFVLLLSDADVGDYNLDSLLKNSSTNAQVVHSHLMDATVPGKVLISQPNVKKMGAISANLPSISEATVWLDQNGLKSRVGLIVEPSAKRIFVHFPNVDWVAEDGLKSLPVNLQAATESLSEDILDEWLKEFHREYVEKPTSITVDKIWKRPYTGGEMVGRPEDGVRDLLQMFLHGCCKSFGASVSKEDDNPSGRIDVTITIHHERDYELLHMELKVIKPAASISQANSQIAKGIKQAVDYKHSSGDRCFSAYACVYDGRALEPIQAHRGYAEDKNVKYRHFSLFHTLH